ncbi:signal transduction histidine kinase/ligand-binding sensor domain-containing protein [Thermonema lapsum]|uniref:histidine kinase n=1 Tax=Thermonema lapsum TaxID=28195 RepID=A0A846MP21_9BACT|nr:sensor histidine kinase [Thermonema lapsum]NIK73152.1 signal transduction histidine kinase/ligand-binding sensor domain-containing protein [Thermonema lapsum]
MNKVVPLCLTRFFVWLMVFHPFFLQAQHYAFRSYGVEEGLPQSQIEDILEDRHGRLWIATLGGIARWNGYNFEVWDERKGLVNNNVHCLLLTSDGYLWCITERGVSRFDGHTFTSFSQKEGFPDGVAFKVWKGKTGKDWWAWVHTEYGEVKLVHYENGRFQEKKLPLPLLSASGYLPDLMMDPNGHMWISNVHGLFYLKSKAEAVDTVWLAPKPKKEGVAYPAIKRLLWAEPSGMLLLSMEIAADSFAIYRAYPNGTMELLPESQKVATAIRTFRDNKGNYWWVLRNGTLLCTQKGNVLHRWDAAHGLPASSVDFFYQDSRGDFWIATNNKLLFYQADSFIQYGEAEGLQSNEVWAIAEDKFNNIWVGTAGRLGLYRYDEEKEYMRQVESRQELPFLGRITAIVPLSDDTLLLGTFYGLWEYSISKNYFANVGEKYGLEGAKQIAHILYEPSTATFWIATLGDGLYKKTPDTVRHYDARSAGLPSNFVRYVFRDSQERLWVCTTYGISVLLPGGQWKHYTRETVRLPNDYVLQATEDPWGNVWFACLGGVLRFDGKQFKFYGGEQGLNSHIVYSILAVDDKLWIGTQTGANCWLINNRGEIMKRRTFEAEEGFVARENNAAAIYHDSRGRLWMGTIQGLHRFDYPQPFRQPKAAFVGISKIYLFLQPIDWTSEEWKAYYETIDPVVRIPLNLKLPHDQNNLTFVFEALDYALAHKLEFSWWMEGLDKQWVPWSKRREITYAGLAPGNYTFWLNVRTSDGDFLLEKPLRYSFTIRPPFYSSTWFFVLIALVLAALVFVIMWWRSERIRLQKQRLEVMIKEAKRDLEEKNKELEEKKKELEAQAHHLEQLNATKDRFFSILAHDIKGPLNSLTAFLDIMSNHLDEMSKEDIQFMSSSLNRSVKNLYQLLENVLSWSRSQMGVIEYNFEEFPLKNVVKENLQLLQMTAANKGIELLDEVPSDIVVYADQPSLHTIIRNLLSNAIKFTAEGGKVSVGAFVDGQKAIVYVRDTGVGMPKEIQERLFKVDKRVSTKGTANETGTGLGLILVKEFVERNGGAIWVESEVEVGTTFYFTLPFRNSSNDRQDNYSQSTEGEQAMH